MGLGLGRAAERGHHRILESMPPKPFGAYQTTWMSLVGSLDALWHLLNFFAPALGMALGAAVMAKLLWRRELAGTGLARLWAWGAGAGVLALVAGLMMLGRDGKMLTYAGAAVATAVALWWAGFVKR
jgi:hypothetical protein